MAHQTLSPPGEGYYVPSHTTDHPHQYAQRHPGPDKSANWADGLEVVPYEQLKDTQHWPEVRQEEVGKEVTPDTALANNWKWKDERDQYNAGRAPEIADTQPSAKPNRKRLCIILGSVLAVILIVAAIFGGVVGSKAARNSKSSTAPVLDSGGAGGSSTTIPTPSQTTTGGGAVSTTAAANAGAVRSGSPFALASWRNDKGNVALYLFYQDKSNDVYYIKHDGATWGKPVNIITGLRRNTRLTATIILNGFGNPARPHVILTYIGGGSSVLGMAINENNHPAVSDDPNIKKMSLGAMANSSTASYYPATVYQDASGELGQARIFMLQWLNRMTGIMALKGLDKNTDIGCVLMASIDKDQNGNEIPIEEDSEEVNRCFFQKGGKLVEARMSGSTGTGEWKIVGEVPLPL